MKLLNALGLVIAVLLVGGCANPTLESIWAPPVLESQSLKPLSRTFRDARFQLEQTQDPAVKKISLAQALDLALEDNLDLALTRAQEAVFSVRLKAARSSFLPQVELRAGTSGTDGRVQGSFGELRDVDIVRYDPQVSVLYRLNLGKQVHDIFAARWESLEAFLQTKTTEQRLLLRVTELYQDLLLAKAGVEIAEALVADSKEFLRIVEAREKRGVGLGADVSRAQAKLAFDQEQELQTKNEWMQASIRLAHVLRLDPWRLLAPSEDTLRTENMIPDNFDPGSHVMNRPDIKGAETSRRAFAERTKAARWDFWEPELSAEVRETLIGDDLSDFEDQEHYGVFLAWLFSFGSLNQIEERKAEERTAELRLEKIKEAALAELASAQESMQSVQERIPVAGKGLKAAKDNLEIQLARYKAGTAMILEVLDAQNTLAQARLNLARAIVSYNRSQAGFLAAAGVIRRELLAPAGSLE